MGSSLLSPCITFITASIMSFFPVPVCQPVEQGSEPGSPAMRMVAVVYVYFLSKFVEFIDTFFFVARKKFNQVSVLHVRKCIYFCPR